MSKKVNYSVCPRNTEDLNQSSMGNVLTFTDALDYQEVEAGILGAALSLITLVGIVALVVWCCKDSCCCAKNSKNHCFFWKNKALACGRCDQKTAHNILTAVFPNLFTKHVRETSPDNEDNNFVMVGVEGEENATEAEVSVDCGYEEAYFIGGKEFDKEELIYRKKCYCHGKRAACCYTYTYFIVATILALLWLIAMTVENAIYRKTGTCNDINVLESSFTCFDITSDSFKLIDCENGSNPDITVFCYLYNPNPGAVGNAYAIAHLIIFGITAYFRLTTKMAEKKPFRVLVIVLQVALYLLIIAVCIGLLVGHFRFKAELYFFKGNAAMRWTIYLLIPITAAVVIPVPWCFFTNEEVHGSVSVDTTRPKPKCTQAQSRSNTPLPLPTSDKPGDATGQYRQSKTTAV